MDYRIDKDALYELVNAEVSKAADEAYAEDGTSLYDAVVLTSKDDETVEAFLADALAAFVKAAPDIASYKKTTSAAATNADYNIDDHFEAGSGSTSTQFILSIYVPDFDTTNQQYAAMEQITRFVTLHACTALFQQRRSILVPEYAGRTQAALDNAIAILRKRNAPSRS